jgi:glycopeptide antibiotics resistance protein
MIAVFHIIMLKKDRKENLKTPAPHLIAAYVFCFLLQSILSATGIPYVYELSVNPLVNTVPFALISTNYIEYIQNIFLFIPFGFLLPLLWKKFGKAQLTFIYGALFSLSIEVIQIFGSRISDIDDLLMNTAGTIIGYFLFVCMKRVIPGISVFSIDEKTHWKCEPYFYFAFAWISMFFIQPFIAHAIMGPMPFAPGGGMPMAM